MNDQRFIQFQCPDCRGHLSVPVNCDFMEKMLSVETGGMTLRQSRIQKLRQRIFRLQRKEAKSLVA